LKRIQLPSPEFSSQILNSAPESQIQRAKEGFRGLRGLQGALEVFSGLLRLKRASGDFGRIL